jgi:hypothetical protein
MDVERKLARRLVLDELFDLSLYRGRRHVATSESRVILERLIPIELRHFHFWQAFPTCRSNGSTWAVGSSFG